MNEHVEEFLICFVVLHYVSVEDTIKCIASIQKMAPESKIILVDNASPNNSGSELNRRYKNSTNIFCLLLERNEGFARGNNAGYKYAREQLHADFIVCINNDTIIEQPDFSNTIINIYNNEHYDVLGPDIYNPIKNTHQNPLRTRALNKSDIRKQQMRSIRLKLIVSLKYLMFKLNISPYRQNMKCNSNNLNKEGTIQNDNLVLHGACLIFSPSYVIKENTAFFDGTFMYMEEDFLRLRCTQNKYIIRLDSRIQILHFDGQSTNASQGSQYKKDLFCIRETEKSRRLLLNEFKKMHVTK